MLGTWLFFLLSLIATRNWPQDKMSESLTEVKTANLELQFLFASPVLISLSSVWNQACDTTQEHQMQTDQLGPVYVSLTALELYTSVCSAQVYNFAPKSAPLPTICVSIATRALTISHSEWATADKLAFAPGSFARVASLPNRRRHIQRTGVNLKFVIKQIYWMFYIQRWKYKKKLFLKGKITVLENVQTQVPTFLAEWGESLYLLFEATVGQRAHESLSDG